MTYFLFFIIQFLLLSTSLGATTPSSTFGMLSPYCQKLLNTTLDGYFKNIPKDEITITPLKGGHSNTCLKISTNSKSYVLRIKDEENPANALKSELFMMQKAANQGIAPQVFYYSDDYKAILIDFIEGGTSTISQNKRPENIVKIADAMRKVHNIPTNPYFEKDAIEILEDVYLAIRQELKIQPQLDRALKLMWKYYDKFKEYYSPKVNIHGELNPRNIFITDKQAIFIDWEYTSVDDPFYDLSYLAIRHDYSPDEEKFLLEAYLEESPYQSELERYYLVKKITFCQLCVFFHYFSLKFNTDKKDLDDTSPLKEWSYYMNLFSDEQDNESLLAQFYYDLARSCLKLAEE
jgi:thiamine kinase-like enzyme